MRGELGKFIRHIGVGRVGVRLQALWLGVAPSGLPRAGVPSDSPSASLGASAKQDGPRHTGSALALDILDWWKLSNTCDGCGAERRDI